jgi:hypothetical protein
MSISIAILGKFLPQIGNGEVHVGGAMLYQHQENERLRLNINVLSLKTTDKQSAPLKIILTCK